MPRIRLDNHQSAESPSLPRGARRSRAPLRLPTSFATASPPPPSARPRVRAGSALGTTDTDRHSSTDRLDHVAKEALVDRSLEPYSLFALANTRPRLHHCSMQIREATVGDAVEACQVVRRSIAELCHADHQDDPIVLEKWLSNNTSDNMRSWIADPDSYVIVATEGAPIIGVGAVTSSAEITLNYVSPDARFRGVSKAILNQLEARALELGNNTCALTSTETARRFYLSAGYVRFGPPEPGIGKGSSYRMVKQLFLTAQAV